ncbi:MAG: glycine cleavage system protein GcvH [Thermoprotei archaeon]|nr:MAG: glycine cleavage system protein GcvH [Thermoprotei archaeon]HDN01794.1 glycine cleavage system protein GcvH [Candidatus Bathyarchaeota archaeon]
MAPDITVKTKLGEYLVKEGLYYTKSDEWVKIEGDTATLGITDYAQKKLRYVVSVELPELGTKINEGDSVATLESVKSVEDIYSPISGEVAEVNEALIDTPDLINKDPYGDGWVVKIKVEGTPDTSKLLTPEAYAEKIRSEES